MLLGFPPAYCFNTSSPKKSIRVPFEVVDTEMITDLHRTSILTQGNNISEQFKNNK